MATNIPKFLSQLVVFLGLGVALSLRDFDGGVRRKRMTGGLTDFIVPFVVNILTRNKTQLCTGAIVHEKFILTAAQCIDSDGIFVVVGGADPQTEGIRPNRTIIHEEYDPRQISKYDLALIELKDALNLENEHISVLPLSDMPWPQNSTTKENGLDCYTAGYGRDIDDVSSNSSTGILRRLTVKAIHGDHACGCLRSFHNRRIICLKEENRGLCTGDMGSPLVCDGKGVGVGHATYQPRNCDQFNIGYNSNACGITQSVYMFVCPYLDWINRTVPGTPRTPKTCKTTTIRADVTSTALLMGIAHFLK